MKRILLLLGVLLPLLLAFTYGGDGSNGFAIGESFTPTNANEIDTALDNLEAGTALASGITRDAEWDTVGEVETVWGSVNIILGTEIDTAAEINALTTDADFLLSTEIGSTVQAYDADLADLADGSLSGSKIGTGLDITTATAGTLATARMATGATLDTEWDTAAEINAATTDIDFMTAAGTQSLVTTGTIQGATSVTTVGTSSATLAAAQMLGTFYYYTSGTGIDVTLPAAESGISACFYDANGGGVIILDAAAGDQIVLDGVGVGTADAIDSAGNLGDFICLLAIDTTTWINLGRSGTWVDGGAD
jgi:hypothetical protein